MSVLQRDRAKSGIIFELSLLRREFNIPVRHKSRPLVNSAAELASQTAKCDGRLMSSHSRGSEPLSTSLDVPDVQIRQGG